jgi:hypothetical protein
MRLGEWTSGKREAPEPLEGNVVGTVLVGTVIWAVLFVVQLPFYGWHEDHDHEWWVWTCLAGVGGGLLGLWYVRRREAAIQAHQRDAGPAGTAEQPPDDRPEP